MTPDMQEYLWTKERHFFSLEIKVGNTWTKHGEDQYQDPTQVQAEARKIASDPSVNAVRILKDDITQRRSIAWEQEVDNVISIPKKFAPTGRKRPCPKCKAVGLVASDGSNEFLFCGACTGAFPV